MLSARCASQFAGDLCQMKASSTEFDANTTKDGVCRRQKCMFKHTLIYLQILWQYGIKSAKSQCIFILPESTNTK